ncbi:rhodanese-like domain containing protein [Klebsormidium nitens]|uniref:Rhodanese-like domain containing protein n=1 Tax=Klebsormidium nitens TaxID=105231 RepID=A0A1Y1IFI6_KLENI|nr:rhodanese-like domain containing protein [Klebsormidium nitens]|eukprot:GAQ88239.1 rhodanese-like domain containing protein [Klebsormidium nitens]
MAGVEEGHSQEHPLVYVSFYKFASLPDYEQLRLAIKQRCDEEGVAGGIIVAPEGINGSICGTRAGIDSVLAYLRSDPRFATMRNTEGPGPSEAPPSPSATGAPKATENVKGNGWVGPKGEEWKATPFQRDRVNVKLKKEVIPLGVEVDPMQRVGTYVKPSEWNALLEDPDVVVVDVRNAYETRIGKFRGAVDPRTESFKDFPEWVERNLLEATASGLDRASSGGAASTAGRGEDTEVDLPDQTEEGDTHRLKRGREEESAARVFWDTGDSGEHEAGTGGQRSETAVQNGLSDLSDGDDSIVKSDQGDETTAGVAEPDVRTTADSAKEKKVAMYCTGGIRCEKSTSLLLQMGFKEVYHLEGGILRYLDEVPPEESLWEGECFVFDRRTSVKHGMEPGSYSLCFACKEPISPAQKESPLYITGIQCPLCAHKKTEKQKERDRQRQRQFETYGLIGGALTRSRPPKKAVAGTKREVAETERVGRWVTCGEQDRREH